jgi:hypothetical protein
LFLFSFLARLAITHYLVLKELKNTYILRFAGFNARTRFLDAKVIQRLSVITPGANQQANRGQHTAPAIHAEIPDIVAGKTENVE